VTKFYAKTFNFFETMQPFKLLVECNFAEFWRYNLFITGATFLSGERTNFIKYVDEVAPVGSNLAEPPRAYSRKPKLELEFENCDAVTLYIYVLPHTMPRTRETNEAKPFELHTTLNRGDEVLYNRRHSIAQWVGDNIEIKFPTEATL
jgi:hypothetical protein